MKDKMIEEIEKEMKKDRTNIEIKAMMKQAKSIKRGILVDDIIDFTIHTFIGVCAIIGFLCILCYGISLLSRYGIL